MTLQPSCSAEFGNGKAKVRASFDRNDSTLLIIKAGKRNNLLRVRTKCQKKNNT